MFRDKVVIGLDIGSSSIKMVEANHGERSGPEIITYGLANHDLELEGYWDHSKLRQLSMIIEDIMQSGNFSGIKTTISVPSKDVYVTTMDFELGWSKNQIKEEINKQAPYFLPYAPETMRLSWELIENDQRVSEYVNKQRVIIYALPDFVTENSKNLLEHVNLDGLSIENQTLAQIRSSLPGDSGITVLVDIGSSQTTFSAVVNGVLRASSHINYGANNLTRSLSENLGVEDEIAGFFKEDLHLVNLFELPRPILDSLATVRSELKTFIDLNKKAAQTPEKIVITGGGASTCGLMPFFSKFEIPVYIANPLLRIGVKDAYKPYINPLSNQLSTAIGLSLRGV